MRKDIHPDYKESKVICACGNVIETRATKEEMHTEICSACHPFFTGKQKFVDAAGRVEKFQTRYGDTWKDKHKKGGAKEEVIAKAKDDITEEVETKTVEA